MTKIQIALLVSLVILLFLYLRYFKSKLVNRLFFLVFFGLGIVFVINPDISQKVATFFGVGRGVDFVIYFLLVVFLFLFINIFYRLRNMDKTITDFIRSKAIEEAKKNEPGS